MAMSSKVQLRLSATKLPRLDMLSPSDAYAVIYARAPGTGAWVEMGRTEVIVDNDSPSWKTACEVVFHFEEVQPLRIVVWDFDSLKEHDYIGEVETTVGRVMGSRGGTQSAPLVDGRSGAPTTAPAAGGAAAGSGKAPKGGLLTISGMELKGGETESLRIGFRATGLDRKDVFGSSDPYLCICAPFPSELAAYQPGQLLEGSPIALTPEAVKAPTRGASGRQRLWTSNTVKNSLDPQWQNTELPVPMLCGGDKDKRPVVLEVWDWNRLESHELIGVSPPISVSEILQLWSMVQAGRPVPIPLLNPTKVGKAGYKNSGQVFPSAAALVVLPTLLDYILGGCQINLMVAVDFTGSNGDPRTPTSLHFNSPMPGAPLNSYAQAIVSVGSILQEYDYDKSFPAFGFGGSLRGTTSHCFPLNGRPDNPEVPGVGGLLQAYYAALNVWSLSGPTNFAPILQEARKLSLTPCAPTQAGQRYTVLLLMTDGAVMDVDETIRSIVNASEDAPLSIVIVGVGNADFSTMRVLDGDGGTLTSDEGKPAVRDIVQFVPFAQYASYPDGGARLAAEVLAEIPSQLVKYFTGRGIRPNPPPAPVYPAAGAVPVPIGPAGGSGGAGAVATAVGPGGQVINVVLTPGPGAASAPPADAGLAAGMAGMQLGGGGGGYPPVSAGGAPYPPGPYPAGGQGYPPR